MKERAALPRPCTLPEIPRWYASPSLARALSLSHTHTYCLTQVRHTSAPIPGIDSPRRLQHTVNTDVRVHYAQKILHECMCQETCAHILHAGKYADTCTCTRTCTGAQCYTKVAAGLDQNECTWSKNAGAQAAARPHQNDANSRHLQPAVRKQVNSLGLTGGIPFPNIRSHYRRPCARSR